MQEKLHIVSGLGTSTAEIEFMYSNVVREVNTGHGEKGYLKLSKSSVSRITNAVLRVFTQHMLYILVPMCGDTHRGGLFMDTKQGEENGSFEML